MKATEGFFGSNRADAAGAAQAQWLTQIFVASTALSGSPVVELNRAVAVSMALGPAAGLELVDALADEPQLRGYHLVPAVRGDLLAKLGRDAEAAEELQRAAFMTRNEREREVLLTKAKACSKGATRQTPGAEDPEGHHS